MSARRRRKRSSSTASDKWKNKTWVNIMTPAYVDEKSLGSSPTTNVEYMIGRTIKTSLMDLTGQFKDLNYELTFKVTRLDGNIGRTEFFGYELSRDFKRAQIRNHRSKVEGIYTFKLSDGARIRVTTFIVTPSRIASSEKKELRKLVYDNLVENMKGMSLPAFVDRLINGSLVETLLEVAEEYTDIKVLDISKVKVLKFQDDVDFEQPVINEEFEDEEEIDEITA
ncbi:MAG: hypothetical protein INQ03_01620 [Candidatus Heimdallarchaeota archaeon]|nr:hypothetical protein [Candidatus Heimdallarchaeota archaeon]